MDNDIVDSGTSGIYLTPAATCTDIITAATPINVGTVLGTCYSYSASCNLHLHTLPAQGGHIILGFQHNLLYIGPLYYRGCKVIYNKHTVESYIKHPMSSSKGYGNQPRNSYRVSLSNQEGTTSRPTTHSLHLLLTHLIWRPTIPMKCQV